MRLKVGLTLMGVLIIAIICLVSMRVVLIGPEGEVLWSAHVGLKAELVFEYSHSVEKVPVLEYYRLNWRGIFLLRETRFTSHGAGLPLDEGKFRVEDGVFIVDGLNRALPEVVIRVSRTPGQRLHLGKNEVLLQEVAEPGMRVRLVSRSWFGCGK